MTKKLIKKIERAEIKENVPILIEKKKSVMCHRKADVQVKFYYPGFNGLNFLSISTISTLC